MQHTQLKIGPLDAGRRMSLEEFDPCLTEPGYDYELERGTIIVTEVPRPTHFRRVNQIRRQLMRYGDTLTNEIYVAGSGEMKLLIPMYDSERHPDLAVYKTQPPCEDRSVWRIWIPEIVVEVISPGSEYRDRVVKPEEYLAFGVPEYWIVDVEENEFLVLRRTGDRWEEESIQSPGTYRTEVLPGFELQLPPIFDIKAPPVSE